MKKQKSNQNVKVGKVVVVFAKTFDHYHQKFNLLLFQLSSKTLKEFETEI